MGSRHVYDIRGGARPLPEERANVEPSTRPLFLGWTGERIAFQNTEAAPGMATNPSKLDRRSWRLLEKLGGIDPVRSKVRAFDRLHTKLLRLRGVQAVSSQGFANSARPDYSKSCVHVSIIVAEYPDADFRSDIEGIFSRVNRRHHTSFVPVILCQKALDSKGIVI